MESFHITGPNQSELVFDGELLACINTPKTGGPDGERGYELALYRKAGGGYVVSVEYLTTYESEQPVTHAEVVDEPKDVENFFFVFEPCEYLDEQLLRLLPDEQKRTLQKSLCRLYDQHVDEILKVLHADAEAAGGGSRSHEVQDNAEDDAGDDKPTEPINRILGFLGLK